MTHPPPGGIKHLGSHFQILGKFIEGRSWGHGHINDTYMAEYSQARMKVRYIHQCINQDVFQDVPRLMNNVFRITSHLQNKLTARDNLEPSREALCLVLTRDGTSYFTDKRGRAWRTYLYIENASTWEVIQNPRQAWEAARAFGQFQNLLADLGGDRLHETIPDFHNTVKRYEHFEKAVQEDSWGRLKTVRKEVDLLLARKERAGGLIGLLKTGELPERITHNDTKLNNVMLDDKSQEGVCVLDLDTTMPGTVVWDFGDMVRTYTCTVAEDEKNLDKVIPRTVLFHALTEGYLSGSRDFITPTEIAHLVEGGIIITLENGLRFLTDYLSGDIYFKTEYEEQNLDRCRTQLKLVKSLEGMEGELKAIVTRLCRELRITC